MFLKVLILCLSFQSSVLSVKPNPNFLDICGIHNGKRLYVEFGISGTLSARFEKIVPRKQNDFEQFISTTSVKKCSVEFVTCPSCIIELKFSFLNISRTCGKTNSLFDTCACDYVLLNEPPFEEVSGEQFCGRFKQNNVTHLGYVSRTRSVAIEFTFGGDFGHAFSLEFTAIRNRIQMEGYPKIGQLNNSSQIITSPFFPHLYPTDLSVEYVIRCNSDEHCRINLVFTDFLLAQSSIIEFFDWNGTRMYVTSGSVFRPPVIVSSGPGLTVRFYANGASDFGFKAVYSFVLGHLGDEILRPNLDCGGHVKNLGGGITMMNMIAEGFRFFDCLWLLKPPSNYMHRKTHLYVKVVNFSDFAGTTELIIRQGLTSNEPIIETIRYPLPHFNPSRQKEHVVPISEGFYMNLRGLFKEKSQVTIVYAAFNYKDCFSGQDFLCQNLRCISMLLNCDGFDHCGDSSDESSTECSQDPRDHRRYSKIPNFLFPKSTTSYSDLTTATFVFLMCTFGLIGIIFAMALLLYRVNIRARHQRRIQDHLETIHAILEEGVGEIEEEIISPDDPPDYEAPPEYADVLKYLRKVTSCGRSNQGEAKKTPQSTNSFKGTQSSPGQSVSTVLIKSEDCQKPTSSKSCQTTKSCQTSPSRAIPESPPPAYENLSTLGIQNPNFEFEERDTLTVEIPGPLNEEKSPFRSFNEASSSTENQNQNKKFKDLEENVSKCFPGKILDDLGISWRQLKNKNLINSKSEPRENLPKETKTIGRFSSEENLLVRSFSESGITCKSDFGENKFWRRCHMRKSCSAADILFPI